jgi:glycopeptide antibiotics resistance protein
MNTCKDSHLDRRARTLAWAGLVVASTLVLVAAFPWGDLQDHSHWSRIGWVPFVSRPVRLGDMALNTLLCAPMGGLSGRLFRRPLLMAFGLSLALSITAEWSQVYSHTRFPSATDVTCNVAGAVLAAALSRRVDSERGEPSGGP